MRECVDARSFAAGQGLLESRAAFTVKAVNGMLPLGFAPNALGAHFKKDEGVRPIAVCEVLRRMVAKVVLKTATPDIQEFFPPLQIEGGAASALQWLACSTWHVLPTQPVLFCLPLACIKS